MILQIRVFSLALILHLARLYLLLLLLLLGIMWVGLSDGESSLWQPRARHPWLDTIGLTGLARIHEVVLWILDCAEQWKGTHIIGAIIALVHAALHPNLKRHITRINSRTPIRRCSELVTRLFEYRWAYCRWESMLHSEWAAAWLSKLWRVGIVFSATFMWVNLEWVEMQGLPNWINVDTFKTSLR